VSVLFRRTGHAIRIHISQTRPPYGAQAFFSRSANGRNVVADEPVSVRTIRFADGETLNRTIQSIIRCASS
jgi:hypothetical protein